MKSNKYSETKILGILKEYDSGLSVEDLSRKHGFNKNTFYNWKKKYSGLNNSLLSELRLLQKENLKLKKLYANESLEKEALKDLIEKKL